MSAASNLPAKPDAQAQAAPVVGKPGWSRTMGADWTNPYRVIVCGGRHWGDGHYDSGTMQAEFEKLPLATIIMHGGAKGADTWAHGWAWAFGFKRAVFKAQWRKYGMRAGPLRNQQMLDEGKPDLVLAFPGGRGTADMVRRARAAGVKVIEVPPAPSLDPTERLACFNAGKRRVRHA